MAITENQLAKRVGNIGASQVAANVGMDPYRNQREVWLECTGRLPPAELDSEAVLMGNILEAPLVEVWKEQKGLSRVIRGGEFRLNGTTGPLDYTLGADALVAPADFDRLDVSRAFEIYQDRFADAAEMQTAWRRAVDSAFNRDQQLPWWRRWPESDASRKRLVQSLVTMARPVDERWTAFLGPNP